MAFISAALVFAATAGAATINISADPNAAVGNFQSPGSTARVGYSITAGDDGTNFNVLLSTSDPNAQQFANLYFDTIASTPNTGSNLGFEFGPGSQDAFDPDSSTRFSTAGDGITALFASNGGVTTATIAIPNSFFLNNPAGMPFTPTPNGTLVSLHLSQSFSYSVVGGSANFAAPVELGDGVVSAATPEPGTMALLALGFGGLTVLRKKARSV